VQFLWVSHISFLVSTELREYIHIALLGSLVYPLLDKGLLLYYIVESSVTDKSLDGVRVACDLMVLFFIYDEFTDKADGEGARYYAEMVMDAIRNPLKARPQGEEKLGEITRQYVFLALMIV
jgi:hypothetical protein